MSIIGEYIICSETDGEDESCSNSQLNLSIDDHGNYLGYSIFLLDQGCDNPISQEESSNDDL